MVLPNWNKVKLNYTHTFRGCEIENHDSKFEHRNGYFTYNHFFPPKLQDGFDDQQSYDGTGQQQQQPVKRTHGEMEGQDRGYHHGGGAHNGDWQQQQQSQPHGRGRGRFGRGGRGDYQGGRGGGRGRWDYSRGRGGRGRYGGRGRF